MNIKQYVSIYAPGSIHESFHREMCLLVNHDFVIPTKGQYYDRKSYIFDIQEDSINILANDIIVIKYFRDENTFDAYAYLDRVIRNGDTIVIKLETHLSKRFIDNNDKLFTNVTHSLEREEKINKCLDI